MNPSLKVSPSKALHLSFSVLLRRMRLVSVRLVFFLNALPLVPHAKTSGKIAVI